MAKVVVPTDLTVAQFVVRVQALLEDYAGELQSPFLHWQMRLASNTRTPLLYPPTPAGTPAHLSSWEQHLPISATGIEHHSVVAVDQDLSALITVFVSGPDRLRTNTPMSKIVVPAHLAVEQFAEAVQTIRFGGELLQWPMTGNPRWQIRLMPGSTVVADAESTRLFPPAADTLETSSPGAPGETISAVGVVHHSVVAISRISLPTAYYGVRCANGFSAVFSSWEGARHFIDGHRVVHGKFKTEHEATVLALHGINLRTSPNALYPPYVPEIDLDAAPADYRSPPTRCITVASGGPMPCTYATAALPGRLVRPVCPS